jgi:DNA anti-recombination protein RmuC
MASNLALKRKCDEVKEAIGADMEGFKERITNQLADSELVKRELEEAKARVIGEIRSELVTIRSDFEGQLRRLMDEAVGSLTRLGMEVDSEMEGAYERSLSKIGADSLAAKTEISEATNKLLKLIADQKTQALKEIAKAAGDNQ